MVNTNVKMNFVSSFKADMTNLQKAMKISL
jgi:hypothetical protein